jgi:hypothetical protein
MVWVTWRQHRAALAGLLALLGCLAVLMLLVGLRARAVYAGRPGCGSSSGCLLSRSDMFDTSPFDSYPAGGFALLLVPVLVGMFLGAPLLAGEIERGTFRFAWTQEMGGRRWTAIKLVLLGASTAVASCLLGLLFTWSCQPYVRLGVASGWQRWDFDVAGVTLACWTLLAFAAGALAGLLIGRTVAAMAATAAGLAVLAGATVLWLNNLLLGIAPITMRTAPYYVGGYDGSQPTALNTYAPPGSGRLTGGWLVRGWFTGPGAREMSSRMIVHVSNAMPAISAAGQLRWLARHHDAFWVTYQPASRFWLFQGVTDVILLLLALLLAAGTIRLLRRRLG